MTTRIKLRRDTAANWTTNDPILALGEAGYDTTNNELRVGDGTTAWSLLSAVGGTGNKITAEKTYSQNYVNGQGQTFTYTNTNIVVQMANNDGLYLNDLLNRWSNHFDGALQFPYNYSNINLVANTDNGDIVSTVTNVVITSGGNPRLYTITLASAPAGSRTIYDIDFNYNYVNTIGLDSVNDYWGMATGDDDINFNSGRDINLEAADDLRLSAHDYFSLTLVDGNDNGDSDGIEIRTQTTSTDYTWTFRLDGSLQLPEGFTLPNKNNTGWNYNYNLNGPTLQLSNDVNNQVIVTGPKPTAGNPSSQRIIIQGQRGFGNWTTSTVGEGGDVYIWGGTGGERDGGRGGSGGDVKMRGGQGQDNDGGYVRIEAGETYHWNTYTGHGGFVEINAGDVANNSSGGNAGNRGGDVRIRGGRAYTATTQSGVVQVITGGYTQGGIAGDKIWTFGNDGTLTFPVLTIATLPLATPAGQRAFISDGESSLAWGVTVGSTGTTTYSVWSDGSNWKIG